jgi:hypothetical protein
MNTDTVTGAYRYTGRFVARRLLTQGRTAHCSIEVVKEAKPP